MKRYYLWVCLMSFGIFQANAQSDTLEVNLKEALDLGEKNRLDLKDQQTLILIDQNELSKIKTRNLPQITGTTDLRWNTQRQQNVIQTDQGDLRSRFGTPFNFSLSLNIDQTIFDPTNQNDKSIALLNRQISEQNLEKARIDVRLAIAQAYYAVLLQEEKVKLSQENTERRQTYDQQAEIKLRQGNMTLTDRTRFALDLENAKTTLQNDKNTLTVNKQNLINQLGLPVKTPVRVKENLQSLLGLSKTEVAQENQIETRVEFKQENLQKQLNALNYAAQNKKRLPTVKAYGNFSVQQLSQNLNPAESDSWTTFNYIGIRADIPIFDGGLKSQTRQEYKLRQEINDNKLKKLSLDLNYEAESARIEWLNAGENLKLAEENLRLAQKLFEADKVKLDNANLTYADYRNSEYSLQTAQNNLLEALYTYLLAQIKWQKANAIL